MEQGTREELERRVVMGARELGIQMVLFRHVVGEKLGVNVTDMECLGLLFNKGLSTPSELARYTGLSSGATTAMLDRLERSGLIERQPNPADRRGTLIVLVKTGTERVAPWFASVRRAQNELVAGYSEGELAILSDFFEKFSGIWQEERKKLKEVIKAG